MKHRNAVLIAAAFAFVCSISMNSNVFAKTAKDCTAEWRADKAGMQARGTTEKAYVEQCKGGPDSTAAAPSPKPAETAPPPIAPRQATTFGSKTAKECTAEWRADKVGMQARGTTEKAYVDQCKGGESPTAAAPNPTPNVAAPAPVPSQPSTASSQKTAKECTAEWRADKAGMQSRGMAEKAYVEQCKAGGAMPTATAPASTPTAAPAPSPTRAAPTETQAAPAPTPQRPAPTSTTAAPAPTPSQPSAPRSTATLEAGQFADEGSAKASCATDTVVWVNQPSKIYHFAGTKSYGTTKHGAYMCEKQAVAADDRASKTEKHP